MPPGDATEFYLQPLKASVYAQGEEFKAFMQKPFILRQAGDHSELVTPKWTGIKAGWLIAQNESFNVFRVDRYAVWAGLVPDYMKGELILEPRYETLKLDAQFLVGAPGELEDAWLRYKDCLLRREEGKGIRIKPTKAFTLAAKLVEDGVIPFLPKKVEATFQWKSDVQLRPYQEHAFNRWLELGALTVVWPYGAGKTYLAIKCIEAASGPTLIVVPSLSLTAQWRRELETHFKREGASSKPRIGEYSGERRVEGDIIVATYQTAIDRLGRRWKLLVFDEAHHYPAQTYSSLAFFDAELRLSLTGSPWREDGRTELIYALGGLPEGQDWETLIREGWVKKPPIFIHISQLKLNVLKHLLDELKGKTLIFCDSIALGHEASKFLAVPFVHGAHSMKARQEHIQKHEKLMCSRIFDEGLDIPDLRYTAELDFLGGSRRQEAQRVGRLMHSAYSKGIEHHILMSDAEFTVYGKRLYALLERGFDVKVEHG